MIPQTLALLKEAGLALTDLQAVVFGRGPGAFTGLRTACSVAQGLAFGADLSVLPIDTLLAVAEEARAANALTGAAPVTRVLAVMDARMEQVYVAAYEFTPNATDASSEANPLQGMWCCVQQPELHRPESMHWPADWSQDSFIAAGNAWPVYAGRWPVALTAPQLMALPTAAALLRLAPAAWAAGQAVPPEEALPLYIRDKVAQTTDERMQIKAQQAAGL
jgi:tRNA threonylcarbamoyladenosine biosynthesis protein TsaB